jgi:ribosomal-protein-alanine N-acetyltransferase
MRHLWPLLLHGDEIMLRPLRYRDRAQWVRVRAENKEWLTPWEATLPRVKGREDEIELPTFFDMVSTLQREGRSGRSYSLMIWHGKNLIGQITMGGVIYGALRGAHVGYWIDRSYAGRGYTTQAVELMSAFAFSELGLHRIEINIRPENAASIRVAQKAGYTFEGERPRYLHIDGAWRDHHCYVKENPFVI